MHLIGSGTAAMRLAGLLLLWVGIAGFVYASSAEPRGFLRRYATDYVAKIDSDFRAMLMPTRGSELALLQLVVFAGALACHAMTNDDRFLIVAAIATTLPQAVIKTLVKRRREKIDAQAHGFALALANTLRTTASVGDALRFTAEVIERPLRDEILIALREMHVGSTAEEALLAAAGRAGAPSLDILVSTIVVGQKTGGDLPKTLQTTAASLRELKRLEEYTDKVTRDPKRALVISFTVLCVTIAMIPRLLPHFLDPLFTTTKGQLVLLNAALLFVGAVIFAWRITRKSI